MNDTEQHPLREASKKPASHSSNQTGIATLTLTEGGTLLQADHYLLLQRWSGTIVWHSYVSCLSEINRD